MKEISARMDGMFAPIARAFGNVEIPQEAFLAVLRTDPDEA